MAHSSKKFMLVAIKSGSEGGICSKNTAVLVQPKFSECLIDSLCSNDKQTELPVDIEEEVNNCQLVLSPSKKKDRNSGNLILAHPDFCPIRKALEEPEKYEFQNEPRFSHIPVSVCVIVESHDGLVLLTRRAKTLKAFPGVWVPPGGYVDPGETVEDAGFRELFEETGLQLDKSELESLETLALWESVYPPTLLRGSSKRHALVVYYCFKMKQSSHKMNTKAQVFGEVDMIGWFDQYSVKAIIGDQQSQDLSSNLLNLHRVIPETSGDLEPCQYPLKNLCKDLKEHAKDVIEDNSSAEENSDSDLDRVSTGTKYALKHWLEKKNKHK